VAHTSNRNYLFPSLEQLVSSFYIYIVPQLDVLVRNIEFSFYAYLLPGVVRQHGILNFDEIRCIIYVYKSWMPTLVAGRDTNK